MCVNADFPASPQSEKSGASRQARKEVEHHLDLTGLINQGGT
jgi:hypothetical protein